MLNKFDILREKLRSGKRPVSKFWPDFDGLDKVEPVSAYFKRMFRACNKPTPLRAVHVHQTNCLDKRGIGVVIAAVCDVVVRQSLEAASLI